MQNTRLTLLFSQIWGQYQQALRNPWRRLLVLMLFLLFGVYLGTAAASAAGQIGYLDITASGVVVIVTEVISWAFYRDRWGWRGTLLGEAINALKVGLVYGLFLIAFLLGS